MRAGLEWAHVLCAHGPHPLWRTVGPYNRRPEATRRAQPHPGHTPSRRPGNAHDLHWRTARWSPSDIKLSQPHIVSAWGTAPHDTSTGRCAAHVIGFRQMIGPPVSDRMMAREDVSTAVASATDIIQLYPLPFVYTVRNDLCEHLPTCGSAAIVRIQYPNMEKRVRLAGFERISARKKFNI